MFSRIFRLPFSQRLTYATTQYFPLFILKTQNNNLSHNRYGFVISKAIDKRSSQRNLFKRRFRAAVEQMHSRLSSGKDLLFILKKGSYSPEKIGEDLDKAKKSL